VTIISAPRIFANGRFFERSAIEIHGERITAFHTPAPQADIELPSGFLSAGLIDLQVNGFAGIDFVSGDAHDWQMARRAIASTGVTSFLPTFITAAISDLVAALSRTVQFLDDDGGHSRGARALGFHLEGPFLNDVRKGAHDAALMCDPTPEVIDQLLAAGRGRLMMVTLAPERPHAITAIRQLTQHGVTVSLGHSDAEERESLAGFDAGAGMVTHVFNAMPPLAHRSPGLVGVALTDSRAHLGLIVDLHHVDRRIVQLVFAAAADRVVLVTDAIAAATMPPGEYELGGQTVHVTEDLPKLTDGTIAGSSLTLDAAIRNAVNICGIPLTHALDSATRIPAETVGAHGVGDLAPGLLADLVWWSDDLRPLQTWINGVSVDE